MRILILAIFTTAFSFAAIDHDRLRQEMEFLKNNAFLDTPKDSESRPYFDRSSEGVSHAPSGVIDLDQKYFSDSVSSGLAAPEKSETLGK